MSTLPTLSVVIPTYNRVADLRRLLESLDQEGRERLDVVVSDNASPDGTEEMVRSFQAPYPLSYYRNGENVGFRKNMYQACARARGDYHLWMGDDDRLLPGSLRAMLQQIDAAPDVGYFFSPVISVHWRTGKVVHCLRNFDSTRFFDPGLPTVVQLAEYAWAMPRLIFRKDAIDWDAWERFLSNGYYAIILAGRAMLKHRACYIAQDLVAITAPEKRYWEEYGNSCEQIRYTTAAHYYACMSAICYDVPDSPQVRGAVREWQRKAQRESTETMQEYYPGTGILKSTRYHRDCFNTSWTVAAAYVLRARLKRSWVGQMPRRVARIPTRLKALLPQWQ